MEGTILKSISSADNIIPMHPTNLEKGLHILADFYEIKKGYEYMTDSNLLQNFCIENVKNSGLTVVGDTFYQFPEGGVTGIVLLAESHVAIHTWPEKNYLTLDIYVCNVTQNNNDKARNLYKIFYDLFYPKRYNHQEIARD